jgi:DNA-binding MarR family transcriptional regulator
MSPDLLKRGNLGLFRLLIAVNQVGPKGISTYKLLHQLGSTHNAKAFIKRAEREGLIVRETGESKHGHFAPVYNRITQKGRQVLQTQLIGGRKKKVNRLQKKKNIT